MEENSSRMPAAEDREDAIRQVVMALPADTRIAAAAWVLYAIDKWRRDGGTYRYFLYDCLRLPSESDAYRILQHAGALELADKLDIAEGHD